jgi:hypothetical protein
VFQYPIDGRVTPGIENTIGFFASILYLRVKLIQDDSFIDLLNRATEEYCSVYEHADPHQMSAQVPPPEFTRCTMFNWVPQGLLQGETTELGSSEDVITCSPVPFEHPMARNLEVDGEPSIFLLDAADGGISGEVSFPMNRFSVDTMGRFGRNVLVLIEALIRKPEGRIKDVLLL